jgi:hypothetical protein
MATWFIVESSSFRVKQDGKGAHDKRVDPTNPLKSLEELEAKVGLTCPEERKKELLEKLQGSNTLPSWLQGIAVPEWYMTASSSDVLNALQWGCDMVQDQKRLSEDKLHDQLDLKWKRILEETQKEMEQKHTEMLQCIAQKDREIQTWQTTAVQNLSASGIEAKIHAARETWMEEQRIMLSTLDRERQTLQQQVEYLHTKASQLEESREILRTKLEQKATQDAILNKSVIKGDIGEEMVDTWLRTAFFGAVVEDTSNETGKMDRHIQWDGTKIVVDIKNHDSKLHSIKDVKKFHTDLENMPDAHIGILLCTNIGVPNHNRFWVETKIINENQLAVYMNNVSANPIERLQLIAGTVIQPWKEYLQLRQRMSESIAGDELRTWRDKAHAVLINGWKSSLRIQEQWTKTSNIMQTSIKEFQEMLVQHIQEMQTDLRTLTIEVDAPTKKNKKQK